MLLDLTCCGGRGLAAHAGGVHGFGRDQIQVLVVWDLIEPVAVLQELDVQVLVDLLQEPRNKNDQNSFRTNSPNPEKVEFTVSEMTATCTPDSYRWC